MSDTHEAGRELDALIAERVMGWNLFEVGYEGTEGETPEQRRYAKALEKQGDNAVGTYAYIGGGKVIAYDNGFCDQFRPSTDIAAAWLVVDALARKKGYVCIEHIHKPKNKWNAWVGEYNVSAATAPLAICRAALAAVSTPSPHQEHDTTEKT